MHISAINSPMFMGLDQTIVAGYARQILDSRGNPTVEAEIILRDGSIGRASAPSGASTGIHEAHELRDGGSAYHGKGVMQAVQNANYLLIPNLLTMDAERQDEIDETMIEIDGTPNKENMGANAILALSLASAKAAAQSLGLSFDEHIKNINEMYGGINLDHVTTLPVPMMNVINGGEHANNSLDIQEFMIAPYGANTIDEAVQMGSEVFHELKKLLDKAGYSTAVGDEGGFAPNFKSQEEALDFLMKAIEKQGYKGKIGICLDVAASELYNEDKDIYHFKKMNKDFTKDELINYYTKLADKYPIISIEDGMAEDDFDGWKKLTDKLGNRLQLVGDDLFVTNPERLQEGIHKKLANAILIKPNQIGTLSETLETINMAQQNGYATVISHRSGETEDTSIASIAAGTAAGQIKTGSASRTDRICKYNELMRIEERVQNSGYGRIDYPGLDAYAAKGKNLSYKA